MRQVRHLTGNNLPTFVLSFVQLLCCNDSYIVHYAPVIAPRSLARSLSDLGCSAAEKRISAKISENFR
uniref:Uncharacterized protein n=1 Tax=Candidatus Kentrum sp. FM TaxID=2126340 RepID=A0A450T0Y9_9GAMM|nr:MAG: hypothetical protein BECKFM1743A_GA0114220_102384 [Candidatus Kentron sp. FM]VFJ60161.1 MAG: hypothetical protein BECKFM1743C_GA0114222_102663 [Candidatus Kentron sp. FM]VFK13692.1 MAG: hypothetical protein BECKFM1743B_GA0114221_102914 [Candidatus Kentron sp. FM]